MVTGAEFARPSTSDVVDDVVGTMANEFEENDSDREPNKSISALFEVVGAAARL